MLTIDGAEGGGQILRTAVSYSAVSGRPVRIVNIRGARPKPGLRPQHLLAVNAAAELCGARVTGADKGSTEIEFTPGRIAPPATWRLDVGTAGSVMLILQALLPCLALADKPVELSIVGGTNNPWAPAFEYLRWVLLPTLERMGFRAGAELDRRGFYPKGGGEVRVTTQPGARIRPIVLRARGALRRMWGISYSSNLPEHIAQRMAGACRDRLERDGFVCDEFDLDTATPGPGPGCGVIAFAEFEHSVIAGDALGERGKPAEKVGREAAQALLRELQSGAAVDAHLGDQLVPWAALADGESVYHAARRTDHLTSAAAVAEQVIGARFEILGDEPAEVRCAGVACAAT
ncbi:MAG: RNA 3'-phosphate cyclase [Armatimonadota bacterium]|nr:MAG: RNA 3'-phosphate cyclase [Armatimonadota bacterium]